MKTIAEAKMIDADIPGYTYGTAEAAESPVSLSQLEQLKESVGFTPEDEEYLHIAGQVLEDQTRQIVDTWRGILSSIPHLARHSRRPDGKPIAQYSENSGLRFQQWILDTCFRPYDQDWLNYQYEIALRHTSLKKNKVDRVDSTPYVPLRDIIAFTAVMNDSIKPFLASKSHGSGDVEKMHRAWCKSLQLQIALWSGPYTQRASSAPNEW